MSDFKLSDKERNYRFQKNDVKEFIRERNILDIEFKQGLITWEEYVNRRDNLAGELK